MSDPSQPILKSRRAAPLLEALPADEPRPEPLLTALPADPVTVEPLDFEEPAVVEPIAPPRSISRADNPVLALVWFCARIPRACALAVVWLFGAAVLMIGLAMLAAVPVLQFLSLGYLLESGARVARSGRLRDGFIGVWRAALLGAVVVSAYLLLLPVRYVSSLAHDAHVIDPGGPVAHNWRIGLLVLIGVTAFVIVLGAIGVLMTLSALTGKLRHLRSERYRRLSGFYIAARDSVWEVTESLRLPYYFWLGCRGFLGAFAWLFFPVSMIALGRLPSCALFGFIGALMLAITLLYLPFLQLRLAATNRLAGAFEIGAVRDDFRRAPWAFCFAFVATLLSALPLYLLKIEMLPRDGALPVTLFFIAFIFPARLLTGWAMSRARRRQKPRHWFFRWTGRLPLLPAAVFYVVVVYFTQFTSWNGVWSLYEQHAFLLPVPFFGM
jgi:hypothetical protein